MILTIQGTSDLFLDLELEVTETAAVTCQSKFRMQD